ncbi:ATP-binding cassette domain-containing protein [bacterium]|nr:ATP-binding cassette domain-containing protein [bacterium]
MYQIKNISYSIGDHPLLSEITWSIPQGRRVALIGPNGAGKTTLFRILCGEITDYRGSIIQPKNYRIGYLPQEERNIQGDTILRSTLEGRKEVLDLEKKLTELNHSLNNSRKDQSPLLDKLGDLERKYEALGGYRLEAQAKAILSGLGFSEKDFSRPLSETSGGWRMRVYLARLLLKDPDLLLLDEPTNHLDLPALEWLEQYLFHYTGSVVFITHDRFFIDRLAHHIYELNQGRLQHYPGNYHQYEKKKRQERELLEKRWKEQQEERRRQERFIQKNRVRSDRAAQVQSRIKQLEKMKEVILPPPPTRLRFHISVDRPSYKDVLKIENMWFRYQKDWIFQDIHFHLTRGEKVALVGVNGAGKTTLTRLIMKELHPQRGSIQLGNRTAIGSYAQHQTASLNMEKTIFEEVASTTPTNHIPKIREVLGIFRFQDEEVDKKIKVLSGGEKARVALAKRLLSPVNFLIMDEPTNHLDMNSREALEHALAQYEGTALLISHDRYFLDKLVNRVVEIKNGALKEYPGNYSYYLEKRNQESKESLDSPKKSPQEKETRKQQRRREAEARQAVSKRRNQLNQEIENIEAKIHDLEKEKSEIEEKMSQPKTYKEGDLIVSLQKNHARIQTELEDLYKKWEDAKLELEEILSQLP